MRFFFSFKKILKVFFSLVRIAAWNFTRFGFTDKIVLTSNLCYGLQLKEKLRSEIKFQILDRT